MGYDFHVTRKAQWFEEHGPIISAEEWARYVDTHAECRWLEVAGRTRQLDDAVCVVDSLGIEIGRLWWCRGEVRTKNPSTELISYMIEAGNALSARVMGDEGETFRDANTPNISRSPYVNLDNLANVWEEPPDGHDAEYLRQQRERWEAYDATTLDDSARRRTHVASANFERKAVLYQRIGMVVALLLLLLIARKAFM
jgi:hypothetical protein